MQPPKRGFIGLSRWCWHLNRIHILFPKEFKRACVEFYICPFGAACGELFGGKEAETVPYTVFKYMVHPSSIHIIRALARNVDSQAWPQPCWDRNAGHGALQLNPPADSNACSSLGSSALWEGSESAYVPLKWQIQGPAESPKRHSRSWGGAVGSSPWEPSTGYTEPQFSVNVFREFSLSRFLTFMRKLRVIIPWAF